MTPPKLGGIELWIEGYVCTGEHQTAQFLGFYPNASTLREAAEQYAAERGIEYYDPVKLTFWGCEFYDNEQDARKSFG